MDLGFNGKVAIVTGASRGLGLASAQALVTEGAHVVVCARGADQLQAAAVDLGTRSTGGAHVLAITADLSSEDGVRSVIDGAVKRFGRIDVLVNNIGLAKGADIEATTDSDWQEAFDQTLFPAIRASRLVVPHMRKQDGGAIVIVSSIFGRES